MVHNVVMETQLSGARFKKERTMETKATLLGRIASVKAEIERLKVEHEGLRNQAVLNGWAIWNYTNDGLKTNKAPDMTWWKAHRGSSFTRLCENSSDKDHPDHKQFWKNPSRLFRVS